jgi:hypothetical protein
LINIRDKVLAQGVAINPRRSDVIGLTKAGDNSVAGQLRLPSQIGKHAAIMEDMDIHANIVSTARGRALFYCTLFQSHFKRRNHVFEIAMPSRLAPAHRRVAS